MVKQVLSFSILIFLSLSSQGASPLQIAQTTCEYMENPLGIDVTKPRFSWTFNNTSRNQFQSAYEILVSENLNDLEQNKGNNWSTGKITDTQNIQIEYTGTPLKSFTRYYWKIRVYNHEGQVSEWSNTAWFETAMLKASDGVTRSRAAETLPASRYALTASERAGGA